MGNVDNHIFEDNLSIAWVNAFFQVINKKEISPLIVSVTGFENGVPIELPEVRDSVDDALVGNNTRLTIARVANTIFPDSLWNKKLPRQDLYKRYISIFERIRKDSRNRNGLYFQRLISYQPKGNDKRPVNQLERIIELWDERLKEHKNPRRSALQAAIYDPTRDLTRQPVRGFPCLQQVAFAPRGGDGLIVTGFYATQYIFERAYGNYVGLCRLGNFMASELGLNLVQMNCVSNIAVLGKTRIGALRPLEKKLAGLLSS